MTNGGLGGCLGGGGEEEHEMEGSCINVCVQGGKGSPWFNVLMMVVTK